MKTLSVMLIFLFISAICYSQTEIDSIFVGSSSQSCGSDLGTAHFPGGDNEMNKFIIANFHVPDSVRAAYPTASVMLKVSINTTGKLTGISVLQGVNHAIDNELVRVFSIMPKWVPGVREGKKISETFALPVKIVFDKTNDEK
jgi:TonB family protein